MYSSRKSLLNMGSISIFPISPLASTFNNLPPIIQPTLPKFLPEHPSSHGPISISFPPLRLQNFHIHPLSLPSGPSPSFFPPSNPQRLPSLPRHLRHPILN